MFQTVSFKRTVFAVLLGFGFAAATVSVSNAVGGGSGGGGSSGSGSASSSNVARDMRSASTRIDAGNYSSALRILRAIVKDDKRNADAYNLLGFASRKLEKYGDAERYYGKALRISARHLGALEYQGELFLILNQPEKARANLALLLGICGANCEQYLDLKGDIAEFDLAS